MLRNSNIKFRIEMLNKFFIFLTSKNGIYKHQQRVLISTRCATKNLKNLQVYIQSGRNKNELAYERNRHYKRSPTSKNVI